LAAAKKEDRAQDVDDLANLLLDQACILDGEIPSDPAAFARRLNGYVVRALGAKT
jgi:molecular chaperone HtpG